MGRYFSFLILLALLLPEHVFSQNEAQKSNIVIGLLVPDSSARWAILAASQAVEKANKLGGYQNQEFELVIRTTEGLWGTGSKESVALVYEDQVAAIVGSLDGRNAHLAEQVAAKSHLAYIECYATEPTLTQAYVPWFLRVVPNDNQQAEAILEIILENGGGKTGILSNDSYDTQYMVRSFNKASSREPGIDPELIKINSLSFDHRKTIEKIRTKGIKHLVLPFDLKNNENFVNSLKESLPSLHLYGALHFTMGASGRHRILDSFEGMYLVSAGPVWMGNEPLFGRDRGAFVSDAMNLVIQAIVKVGTNREEIKNYLMETEIHEGQTGPVRFDKLGNRQGKPVVVRIKNGKREIRYIK
jgi:ABC-type branched-subunit amino acid transport system substrate-binding protein